MAKANWDNIKITELDDALAGKIKWTRNMPGHYQAKVVVLVEGMGGAQRKDHNGVSCGMQIVTFEADLIESGYEASGVWMLRVCTNGRDFDWIESCERFKDCKVIAVEQCLRGFKQTENHSEWLRNLKCALAQGHSFTETSAK